MNKKVLKYILYINSFGLGGSLPPCFADKIFFERRVTDFWSSATPYSNNKCSSKAFGDQRFPMWSILVTKSVQAPMFRWPKVSKLQRLGDQKSGGLCRCPGVLILAPMSGRWVGWDKGTPVLTSPWCCMVLLRNACCTVLQARGSVLNVNSDLLSHSSLSHCTAMVL